MEWLKDIEWEKVLVILLAAHTLAKAIVDATKTKKDDEIFTKISSVFMYLIGKRPS